MSFSVPCLPTPWSSYVDLHQGTTFDVLLVFYLLQLIT